MLTALTTLTLPAPLQAVQDSQTSSSSPRAAVNGFQKTIVILVKFPDQSNSTRPSQIQSILSAMNDYYTEDSYGTTTFQTTLAPNGPSWYTMPSSMTYYGTDTAAADNQLVDDGLRAVYNAGIDLTQYGFAIIVHAGDDEAMTRTSSDIHSFTIPGYVFNPIPLVSIRISASVVSESDPMGVYAHESGHLLGLPDLYDVTGTIDPSNNFMGYWEIMALGEWNPNNGNPLIQPGTYPSLHSAWSKMQLGWLAGGQVLTVQSGTAVNVTLENLEQTTGGVQAVKIPIAYNGDGTMTYYLVETRAKLGTYDQYLPFPSSYPDAGLLVYHVNESITAGHGSVRLIDAHPGGNLNDAPFGPCLAPCTSNNTLWDTTNYVKIIVSNTNSTAYSITIDRTNAPALLLQVSVNPRSQGVLVSVDGVNITSDASGELRIPVRYGPHTVYVQPRIPITLGGSTVTIGLSNSFTVWEDGSSQNPRGVSVTKDTLLTATYRVSIEPSTSIALISAVALALIVLAITLQKRHAHSKMLKASSAPTSTPVETLQPGKAENVTPKE